MESHADSKILPMLKDQDDVDDKVLEGAKKRDILGNLSMEQIDFRKDFAEEEYIDRVKIHEEKLLYEKMMKLMAIPDFDPEARKADIYELCVKPCYEKGLTSKIIGDALVMKGYPSFWVSSLTSAGAQKRMTQLDTMYDRREQKMVYNASYHASKSSSSAKAALQAVIPKGSGRNTEHWRIPYEEPVGAGRIPKPKAAMEYVSNGSGGITKRWYHNRSAFRNWVWSECRRLKPLLKGNKLWFITGTESCQALFYSSSVACTFDEYKKMLDHSSVYIASYREGQGKVADFRGSVYNPEDRVFPIGVKTISSMNDVMIYQQNFKKHKNLEALLVKAFSNDQNVRRQINVPKLRQLCEKVFPKDFVPSVSDYKFEGQTYSFDHNINLPDEQKVASVIKEVAGKFNVSFEGRCVDSLVRFFFLCFGLSHNDNWQSAMSTLGLFAMSDRRVWDEVKDRFVGFVDAHFEGKDDKESSGSAQGEAQNDEDDKSGGIGESMRGFCRDLKDRFFESAVYTGVIAVIYEFFANFSTHLSGAVQGLISALRFSLTREIASNMATAIITGVTEVLARFKKCWESRSLDPLWGADFDTEGFIKDSEAMIVYMPYMLAVNRANVGAMDELERLRKDGKIASFWTCPVSLPIYEERAKVLVERAKKMIVYFSSNSVIVNILTKQLNKFEGHLARLRLQNSKSRMKMAPFFIYVHGRPGAGKSTACVAVEQAFCNKYGWDYASCLFNWQKCVNFQTGLNQQSVIIDYDDIDTSTAPVQAGVPNHIECYMAMGNNNPHPVEESESSLKGTSVATPLLMLAKSNFHDARVWDYSNEPLAFFRRINVLAEFVPNKQFGTSGKLPQLDKGKATRSLTHDMFDVKVRMFDASLWVPGEKSFPFSKEVVMTFSNFVKFSLDLMDIHLQQQEALLNANSVEGDFCPSCFLPKNKSCGCTLMKQDVIDEDFRKKAEKVLRDKYKYDVAQHVASTMNWMKSDGDIVECVQKEDGKIVLKSKLTEVDVFPDDVSFEGLQDIALYPVWYIGRMCGKAFWNVMHFFSDVRATVEHWIKPNIIKRLKREIIIWSATIIASIGLSYGIIKALMAVFQKAKTLQVFEGRENNATGAPLKQWVQAEQSYKPGLPPPKYNATWTKAELLKQIQESYVTCKCSGMNVIGSLISHNTLVIPSHILPGEQIDVRAEIDGQILNVIFPEKSVQVVLTKFNCRRLASNPNALVVRCGTLKPTTAITNKFWKVRDEGIHTFDEYELVLPSSTLTSTANQVIRLVGQVVIESDLQTVAGHCGYLNIASVNGHWRIVGQHYLKTSITGVDKSSRAVSYVLTESDLAFSVQSIGAVFQGVCAPQLFYTKVEMPPVCSHYPMMSEVNSARASINAQPYCLGTLHPPLSGSTIKTRLKWAITKEKFSPLILRWCDGASDYWRLPNFKGKMEDEKWKSWYTNAFTTQNVGVPRPEILVCAMYDYLTGIDQLLREGYREISEKEAITGIPGSIINPVKLDTSFGPPYAESKHNHIFIDEERTAFLSPEAMKMAEQFDDIVDGGQIPCVIGNAFPKDEAIKKTKEFGRLFTVLPGIANLKYKQVFSQIKAFLRSNTDFFGSCVGINMTSAEINKIIDAFRALDPTLKRIIDADLKMMDKSFHGDVFDIVALVIFAITFVLGGDAFRAYTLATSIKVTVTSIKNDLVITFWNPSGNDITIEINCIGNQIMFRYCYFNKKYPKASDVPVFVSEWFSTFFTDPIPKVKLEFDFRADVCLRTFGDDSVQARREGVELEEDLVEVCRDHLGFIVTAGNKADRISFVGLSEAVFLKRRFIFDKELNMYIPPLDLKSLARMLTIKKDSRFTDRDHACISISECIRELAYHPRKEFDDFMAIANEFIHEQQLSQNPYLRLFSYDFLREKIRSGTFQTWEERIKVPLKEVDGLDLGEDFSA